MDGNTPLPGTEERLTLSDLGIVGGDLLYIILKDNSNTPTSSQVSFAEAQKSRDIRTGLQSHASSHDNVSALSHAKSSEKETSCVVPADEKYAEVLYQLLEMGFSKVKLIKQDNTTLSELSQLCRKDLCVEELEGGALGSLNSKTKQFSPPRGK